MRLDWSESSSVTDELLNFTAVEPIFEPMSCCAALHPDPEDEVGGNYDASVDPSSFEVFFGDRGQKSVGYAAISSMIAVMRLTRKQAALEHLESVVYNPFEEKK